MQGLQTLWSLGLLFCTNSLGLLCLIYVFFIQGVQEKLRADCVVAVEER